MSVNHIPIIKSTIPTLKQAIFVALVPDEVDLHGDVYNETEVRKACHNYNVFCRKSNLKHIEDTTGFTVVESYILPVDLVISETFVKKGAWITVLQFNSDELWNSVLSGEFNGVSVGCKAKGESL